jgi:hypothetical protein
MGPRSPPTGDRRAGPRASRAQSGRRRSVRLHPRPHCAPEARGPKKSSRSPRAEDAAAPTIRPPPPPPVNAPPLGTACVPRAVRPARIHRSPTNSNPQSPRPTTLHRMHGDLPRHFMRASTSVECGTRARVRSRRPSTLDGGDRRLRLRFAGACIRRANLAVFGGAPRSGCGTSAPASHAVVDNGPGWPAGGGRSQCWSPRAAACHGGGGGQPVAQRDAASPVATLRRTKAGGVQGGTSV